ncbi:MAG: hypothetical protein GC201_11040 [Alphaproteobacteria bacterium]|nr:hypothetical protein [Alphaproteobacteria bacterium]
MTAGEGEKRPNPRNHLGTWRVRRRIIHLTLLFCAAQVAFLTLWGHDTRLAETLAWGAYALAGSVIGAYVFGAAWEDISDRRTDRYDGGYGNGY